MPEDNQNDQPLDWTSAPQQFREAHNRQQEQMRQLQEQAAQVEQLQRQNAMLAAGVDMTHPASTYFVSGYQGELDPDAIKQEWAKLAPPPAATPGAEGEQPPSQEQQPGDTPDQQALQQARDRLNADGHPPGQEPTPDPVQDMMHTFNEARQAGRNLEQAQRAGIQKLVNAAVAGDERVVSGSVIESVEKYRAKYQ